MLCFKIDRKAFLAELSQAYSHILTQHHSDLITIVPSKLNQYKQKEKFILKEITRASEQLLEKITSIHEIKDENKYNDLLVVLIRQRLSGWDWEVTDQPRGGSSDSDKPNPGEKDIEIKSNGESLATLEALVFRDKRRIKKHLNKIFDYSPNT